MFIHMKLFCLNTILLWRMVFVLENLVILIFKSFSISLKASIPFLKMVYPTEIGARPKYLFLGALSHSVQRKSRRKSVYNCKAGYHYSVANLFDLTNSELAPFVPRFKSCQIINSFQIEFIWFTKASRCFCT